MRWNKYYSLEACARVASFVLRGFYNLLRISRWSFEIWRNFEVHKGSWNISQLRVEKTPQSLSSKLQSINQHSLPLIMADKISLNSRLFLQLLNNTFHLHPHHSSTNPMSIFIEVSFQTQALNLIHLIRCYHFVSYFANLKQAARLASRNILNRTLARLEHREK